MLKNAKKAKLFKKVKNKHTILPEFINFLQKIEKNEKIEKIIPWRINRQQKWSSKIFIHFSYFTQSWLKYNIAKWWTAQELFIICKEENKEKVKEHIDKIIKNFSDKK